MIATKDRVGYALFNGGELVWVDHDLELVLKEAKLCVDQYIADFMRHDLPLLVTEEIATRVDVEVHKLTKDTRTKLPLQQWFDEYYEQQEKYKEDDARREYEHALSLFKKYKDRLLKETENENLE